MMKAALNFPAIVALNTTPSNQTMPKALSRDVKRGEDQGYDDFGPDIHSLFQKIKTLVHFIHVGLPIPVHE